MRTGRVGMACLGLLLGLLAAGCTDDGEPEAPVPGAVDPEPVPSSPSGARVAVVLPPSSAVAPAVLEDLDAQLDRLADTVDDEIRQLRAYPAADPAFVADVASWLAEQRTELVCVLGDQGEAVVEPLAALYHDVRFCALPTGEAGAQAPEDDDGVARVDVRAEELGYLVGVAARAQARGAAVGLVLGGGELPSERFRAGLLAGLAGAEVVEADVPGEVDASLADRAEAVLAAEAAVVVVDAGVGAADAIAAIDGRATVLAPAVLVGGVDEARVTLTWTVRWDRALAGPLGSILGAGDGSLRSTVGLREEVFEVGMGAAATIGVRSAVTAATEGLVAGDLDPRVPVPLPEPSKPAPSEDPDDSEGSGDPGSGDPDGSEADVPEDEPADA